MTAEFFQECVRYARAKTRGRGGLSEDIASEMYLLFAESGGKSASLRWLFVDALRKLTKWSRHHKASMDPLRSAQSTRIGEGGEHLDIFESLDSPDPDAGSLELDAGTVQTMCTKLRRLRRLERAIATGDLVKPEDETAPRERSVQPTRPWDAPLTHAPLLPVPAPEPKKPPPKDAFDVGFELCL